MVLPISFKTQNEIPEGLREHYIEKDNVWVLDGYVAKTKLEEFRENNRNLAKDKEALQGQLLKFRDIDPEKYQEAVTKLQELENAQLESAGEWKVLKANMEQAHTEEMKKQKDVTKGVEQNWNKEKIANQTAMIVMKHAVPEEGNMKYVQRDVLELATIDSETNQIVFLDEKGLKKKNEEGDKDLTLEEFLVKTYIPKSKLFVRSSGGGALGADEIPRVGVNQVHVDSISGKDVSRDTIDKLASGELVAVG